MANSAIKGLLIRLSVLGAGLYPMLACALGLGEIQLDSRLNQPLRARIEVFDVSDEEWKHIRTRLSWETSQDAPPLRPEIFDSVTLRAIEDANHRHFVEVKSAGVVTEPLFDLPVEIAGAGTRVIRNYAVLLDPPGADDEVQRARQAPPQTSVSREPYGDERQARPSPPATSTSNERHRHKRHTHTAARVTAKPAAAAAAGTEPPASKGLGKQLDALQQTLIKMQATIAAQNAQIVDLTAKVAARAEYQRPPSRASDKGLRPAPTAGSINP